MKERHAFTLIELLVAIAIIGVLATFSVVQFTGARERARMANGLHFESQILTAAGDELIGRWDFDECNGVSAADTSGNGFSATLSNASLWPSDTPSGKGCSISLNGVDQYAYAESGINALIVQGAPLTLSAWVKGNASPWDGSGTFIGVISSRNANGAYVMDTIAGTSQMGVWISDGTAWAGYYSSSVSDTRDWHHYVSVYDGSTTTFYIDGVKKGTSAALSCTMSPPTGARIYFGSDSLLGSRYLNGRIDNVRIYRKLLTAKDVQMLFVSDSGRSADLAVFDSR